MNPWFFYEIRYLTVCVHEYDQFIQSSVKMFLVGSYNSRPLVLVAEQRLVHEKSWLFLVGVSEAVCPRSALWVVADCNSALEMGKSRKEQYVLQVQTF